MNVLDPIEGVPPMDWTGLLWVGLGATLAGVAFFLAAMFVATVMDAALRKYQEWKDER